MKQPLTPAAAMERLETLCARSEQCEYDLARKLRGWGLAPGVARQIIEELRSRRYVDDSRFARAWCRDRYRFQRWGRLKIRQSLTARHISTDVISSALAEIDEAEYIDALTAVVKAKARQLGDEADTYEGRTKLLRHAASRGYEPALIIDVIKGMKEWE